MMIAIDLSKQQAINADPNATEQNNFTGNRTNNNFFIIEGIKETNLDFSKGTVKVL